MTRVIVYPPLFLLLQGYLDHLRMGCCVSTIGDSLNRKCSPSAEASLHQLRLEVVRHPAKQQRVSMSLSIHDSTWTLTANGDVPRCPEFFTESLHAIFDTRIRFLKFDPKVSESTSRKRRSLSVMPKVSR